MLLAVIHTQSVVGRPFTVTDDIQFAHFGNTSSSDAVASSRSLSPNGQYMGALIERGHVDLGRLEDTLRIYRTHDLRAYVKAPKASQPPPAFWEITLSTDKDGPIITRWRWLNDSTGIAFLQRGIDGRIRLAMADVEHRTIQPLTPDTVDVRAYDITDRRHFVYAVADQGLLRRAIDERSAPAIVVSDRPLSDLLFPVDENPGMARWADRAELWAVNGDNPFPVKDRSDGRDVVVFAEGQQNLALSPDGQSVISVLAVPEVPALWARLYPPPSLHEASLTRMRIGSQDLATFSGYDLVSRYVHIDLRSGVIRPLSDGPTGTAAGWYSGAAPTWSQDGNSVALPNAFVDSGGQTPTQACVAVATLKSQAIDCVEPIQGQDESGAGQARYIDGVWFEDAAGRVLRMSYSLNDANSQRITTFRRTTAGSWVVAERTRVSRPGSSQRLRVAVKQGLNAPPVLVATDTATKITRAIWDPNPQLEKIDLGDVEVFTWKDKSGRDWQGGLFKPVPYEPGRRYPLVIQTHGFIETEFRPSGLFPTAFAARALAGTGMVVLQAGVCPISLTPEEGPCNVEGFEAAVNDLVNQGLVDAERVGIIGFSRTCFHVMELLTMSPLHIKAASVTDGVMEGYFHYIMSAGDSLSVAASEYDAMVGARPFGEGLQVWLKRSPLFNMDKVTAPVLLVGEGRYSLLGMWEPYAALRSLNKPTELVLLNSDEHVLTNPATRLASQGGTVDWFRFWLQDYEDPDPAKVEQYKRWRELRKLQEAQDAERVKATADEPATVH